MIETKICQKCGVEKPLDEFYNHESMKKGKLSKCKECVKKYNTEYYQKHKEKIIKDNKKYYEEIGREKKGSKSMYENKSCASYFGIVVAERLCKHLFNDVVMMPNGFPGYDMICNHGKKINVKASSLLKKNGKYPYWGFTINKNNVADFFLCVAFDNVDDLNPLHMWMIPGKEVNHLKGIEIRPTTIHKWDEWKRTIEEVQLCCTQMKHPVI